MKLPIFLAIVTAISVSSAELRTIELLCEPDDLPCGGWGCYKIATEICHKLGQDRIKCKKEESLCRRNDRGVCYSAKTHNCFADTDYPVGIVICLKGLQLCGPNCFDPNKQICLENGLLCLKGQLVCKSGNENEKSICYDPEVHQCSNGKLCTVQQKACSGECYPSNIKKKCFRTHYNYPWDEVTSYTTLW